MNPEHPETVLKHFMSVLRNSEPPQLLREKFSPHGDTAFSLINEQAPQAAWPCSTFLEIKIATEDTELNLCH